MRKFFSAILLTFCLALYSAGPYYTCPWRGNIRTLQVRNTSSRILERPMLVLGSGEQLEISFDELSHNGHNYSYTIEHCNADWTPSDLFSGEYLQGFTTADITDYLTSLNTSVNYTHYRFLIPNEDMQLLRSGNYCVRIYEDNDPKNRTIATACFSVVDPHIDISANIRSQTDIELNNRYQQLDISLNTRSVPLRDPMSELTVVVRQNGRLDNQVTRIGGRAGQRKRTRTERASATTTPTTRQGASSTGASRATSTSGPRRTRCGWTRPARSSGGA